MLLNSIFYMKCKEVKEAEKKKKKKETKNLDGNSRRLTNALECVETRKE